LKDKTYTSGGMKVLAKCPTRDARISMLYYLTRSTYPHGNQSK